MTDMEDAKDAFDNRCGCSGDWRTAYVTEAIYYQNNEIIRLLTKIAGENS